MDVFLIIRTDDLVNTVFFARVVLMITSRPSARGSRFSSNLAYPLCSPMKKLAKFGR
jgi:hypothetical protein